MSSKQTAKAAAISDGGFYPRGRSTRRSLRNLGLALTLTLGSGTLGSGCANLNFFTVEEDVSLGSEAFAQVVAQEPIIQSGKDAQMVERVMRRIAAVTEYADTFPWEVVLIDAPETVNAFCLPGGKMAVYSGILPVAQNEAGLAVVMGHEIAHATERHGTERMSRQSGIDILLQQFAGDYTEMASMAVNLAVGLPWGRGDELEADRRGLIYMARAGYDPRVAVPFWERMSSGGGGPPEFLSTHPSGENRIQQLQEWMPEAVRIYEASKGQ